MTGSARGWMKAGLLAVAVLWSMAPAGAQAAAWRCVAGGKVTYSQMPCPGGREVGAPPRRVTDKSRPPPQDRAVAAKRARLTPQERQECRVLDQRLRDEERSLRRKGEAATLQDEMPLVDAKKQFRELKC